VLELEMPVHGGEHNVQCCVYVLAVLEAEEMVQIVEYLQQYKHYKISLNNPITRLTLVSSTGLS